MPIDRFLHPRAGHSNKVSQLSDFAYRVWTQYILSADDFGVMRASGIALQADNDAFAKRKAAAVQKAFDAVIDVGLVRTFEHQGRRYVCQLDWQTWQKVGWPRITTEPKPPDIVIAACDAPTRTLFALYPGGQRKGKGGRFTPSGSESTSGELPENFESTSGELRSTRAGGRAERLRLPAPAEAMAMATAPPPLDLWFRELCAAYPPQSVSAGYLTQTAFIDAITADGRDPSVVFAEMVEHLANQTRGYQWRVTRMIPKLEKWLREGLWRQLHDEHPPTAVIGEKTLHTAIAADAFVKGGGNGAH